MIVIERMWSGTPDDSRPIVALALAMPILMLSYQLGWTQEIARGIFNTSIMALTVCLAQQVKTRWSYVGDALEYGVLALWIVSLTFILETIPWRIVTGLEQGFMVAAWVAVWRVRRRWLARTIAFRAMWVAAIGLGAYLLSNFALADPMITETQAWGAVARGVIGRTILPFIEPLMALVLWALVVPVWLKFLRSHGAV